MDSVFELTPEEKKRAGMSFKGDSYMIRTPSRANYRGAQNNRNRKKKKKKGPKAGFGYAVGTIFLLLVLYPIGLIFLWARRLRWRVSSKLLATVVGALVCIFVTSFLLNVETDSIFLKGVQDDAKRGLDVVADYTLDTCDKCGAFIDENVEKFTETGSKVLDAVKIKTAEGVQYIGGNYDFVKNNIGGTLEKMGTHSLTELRAIQDGTWPLPKPTPTPTPEPTPEPTPTPTPTPAPTPTPTPVPTEEPAAEEGTELTGETDLVTPEPPIVTPDPEPEIVTPEPAPTESKTLSLPGAAFVEPIGETPADTEETVLEVPADDAVPQETFAPDDTEPDEAEPAAAEPKNVITPKNAEEFPVYYVTKKSTYYHTVIDCQGMKAATEHTLADAKADGKKMCKVCGAPSLDLLGEAVAWVDEEGHAHTTDECPDFAEGKVTLRLFKDAMKDENITFCSICGAASIVID